MSLLARTTLNNAFCVVGLVAFLTSVGGCHSHDHTSERKKPEKKEQEPQTESVTLWTQKTELFMEYPPIVVGKPTDFVIHLTHLRAPFQPVRRGQLTLTFSDGKDRTVVRVDRLLRTGIFKPTATLKRAGTYTLTLDLVAGAWRDRLTVQGIRVSPPGKPRTAPDEPKKSALEQFDYQGQEISFLKEAQWVIPFETRVLRKTPIPQTYQTYGAVVATPNSRRVVNAPVSGLITELSPALSVHQWVKPLDPALTILTQQGASESYGQLRAALGLARDRVQAALTRQRAMAELVRSGLEPRAKLVLLKSDVSVSRGALRVEQARLAAFRKLQQGTKGVRITVPIAGKLKRILVTKGAFVSVGQPLFEVVNPKRFKLKVFYPLSLRHRVAELEGIAFRSTAESPPRRLRIPPLVRSEIDRGSNSLVLLYPLPSDAIPWLEGQELTVYLQFKTQPGFRVPATAIVNDNGRSIIYLQKEGESLYAHPVRVRSIDHHWRQISGNLLDGLRLVTLGSYTVYLSTLGTKKVGHGHSH